MSLQSSLPVYRRSLRPVRRATGRAMLHATLVTLGVAAIVCGLLAKLTGAPDLVAAAPIVAGILAIFMVRASQRDTLRRAALDEIDEAKSREQFESLADRMWELQESEERFRGLIDALGDLVVHRDRDGRIVYANSVFANLLETDSKLLAGRTLAELGIEVGIVPDAAFADGECLSSTDVAIHTHTGTRWFSWIELSVRDKVSDAVSHRAIARDITDHKRAEKASVAARERAEYASRAKSRFLATVSHEIRTPMNGIMGMAKLLADTDLSPEQQTYVGAVSTSSAALLALIEDLLDFSKIEAGRFDLEPQPVSPRELAENVVELLAARAYGKDIGLGCHIAPDVPALITTDPGRLRQVLLNLIGNAIKFTDDGGVLVAVRMGGTAEDPRIRFSVADTGPGLAAADRARIFQEFEQADGTSTRKHGGAGLGLAISKRITEAMGGTISVESTKGKGSVFTVEFAPPGLANPQEPPAHPLENIGVVILSKNTIEAEAIALTVRAHGGSAWVASTVEETVARLREGEAGAVMVDAALETGDGALLGRLREMSPVTFQALTLIAPTDRGRLAEFRANGYASFLARPVRGETLVRLLRLAGDSPEAKSGCVRRRAANAPRRLAGVGLSVLLAEDNEINALLARATLVKAGHSVDVVGNGKAAVEAVTGGAGAKRYDIVLMDLHMPVMDGLDAIAMIRKFEESKGLPPVPIMVLTADSQEKTRHGVLAHGASGFVSKPLDPAQLVETVEQQAAA